MSGIVFFRTGMLEKLKEFYTETIGCTVWLEQADCVILRHGNLIFGLCKRDKVEAAKEGLITFFYDSKRAVDSMYALLKDRAESKPTANARYKIYQFFAADPEGRKLEFQWFNDPVSGHLSGVELMRQRRSVRDYRKKQVPDELIVRIIEDCRFAPSSMNAQSYYFKVIKDRDQLESLGIVKGQNSRPILEARTAIAVCADPKLSKQPDQDACIATYHLMLTAWFYGLGTCWIGDMNTDRVKKMLKVPRDHYVATVTPLGYPKNLPVEVPERKDSSWFLRE